MKRILFSIIILSSLAGTCFAAEPFPGYGERTKDFIMEGAAADLQANKDIYVEMKNNVDAVSALSWSIILSRKLTSQPAAVIEIMALTGSDVENLCPAPFMEGTEVYEIHYWMRDATEVLSSIRMADPAKDKIRSDCLARIMERHKALKAEHSYLNKLK